MFSYEKKNYNDYGEYSNMDEVIKKAQECNYPLLDKIVKIKERDWGNKITSSFIQEILYEFQKIILDWWIKLKNNSYILEYILGQHPNDNFIPNTLILKDYVFTSNFKKRNFI